MSDAYDIEWRAGTWNVIRRRDGVTVKQHHRLQTCLRWVQTWGDVDLGR